MSRIIYSTSEQEILSIDWFVCDSRGYIGHFASGGTMLPPFIADDRQTNEVLHRYFFGLRVIGEATINPNLCNIKLLQNIPVESYARSFSRMARKGLFSFDNIRPGNLSHMRYVLVAAPAVQLKLEHLPPILEKMIPRLPYAFREVMPFG